MNTLPYDNPMTNLLVKICLAVSLIPLQVAFAQGPIVVTNVGQEVLSIHYVDLFGNKIHGLLSGQKGNKLEVNSTWPVMIYHGKNTIQSNVLAMPGDTIRLRYDDAEKYAKVVGKDSSYSALEKISRIPGLSTNYHSGFDIRKTEISDFAVVFKTLDSCHLRRLEIIEDYAAGDSTYQSLLRKEMHYYRLSDLLRPFLSTDTNVENIPAWYTDSIKVIKNLIDKDSLYMGGDEYRMGLVNYNTFICRDSLSGKSDIETFYTLFRSAEKNFGGLQQSFLMAWILRKYNSSNLPDFQFYLNKFYDGCSEESFLSYIVDKVDTSNFKYPEQILATELTNIDGSKISWQQILNKHRGKVVLIDLWASWCAPCYTELPLLKKLKERYEANGFEIIALTLDDNRKDWKSGLRRYKKRFHNNEQYYIGLKRYNMGGLLQFLLTRRENEKIPIGVPRYIILNKDGKNVVTEAPRPNTKQIHTVINTFLSEIPK